MPTDAPTTALAWLGRAKRAVIIVTAPLWVLAFFLAAVCVGLAVSICWAVTPLVWVWTDLLTPLAKWVWHGDRRYV